MVFVKGLFRDIIRQKSQPIMGSSKKPKYTAMTFVNAPSRIPCRFWHTSIKSPQKQQKGPVSFRQGPFRGAEGQD